MAYIGKQPVVGNFQVCDAISVVNGQAAYTMQVGSANVNPENANHMLVSLNGVLQKPGSSFTISGATITFASNLATGDVIDFIILLGNVLDLGTPSDETVTNAKLASDLISGETDIGGAIADADLFLVDDGAGGTLRKTAASRLKTYIGAAGLVKLSSQTISSGVSSVDFLSSFSATYDNYVLFYSNLGVVTDSVDIELRVASSTGTISGSDYIYGFGETRSNNSHRSTNSTGDTKLILTYSNMGNAATESSSGIIRFYGTQNTTHHKMINAIHSGMSTGSDAMGTHSVGACKTTSALVGFTMFAGSGNIDSGEFVLFGVTK